MGLWVASEILLGRFRRGKPVEGLDPVSPACSALGGTGRLPDRDRIFPKRDFPPVSICDLLLDPFTGTGLIPEGLDCPPGILCQNLEHSGQAVGKIFPAHHGE